MLGPCCKVGGLYHLGLCVSAVRSPQWRAWEAQVEMLHL